MNKSKNILRGVRAFSPLLQAYENGYAADDIKASVMETLIEEFQNTEMLERYGIDLLAVEAVNITKIRSIDWASELYDRCIGIRQDYLVMNSGECAETCAYWEEHIGKALSLYWNAVRFEQEKSNLPLDEFAYELFRNIGALIEGTLQVYLKELLHLAQRLRGEPTSFSDIQSLDLGAAVRLVGEKANISTFLTLSPWNVPLNQWRNIAQHYSMDSSGSTIVCQYGSRLQHSISLQRSELLDIARDLVQLFATVRTAQTIFTLDHADILISHCKGFERREKDLLFQFAVGAASQGFEVIDLEVSEEKARALMIDVTEQDQTVRSIHASQFVYNLWVATKSSQLIIEYRTKSGDYSLKTTAEALDCEKVFNGTEEISYLARIVRFEPSRFTN